MEPICKTARVRRGVALPYVERGDHDGLPVVLLHGVTDSWRSFEPVLPHLPSAIRAFALTQRGHGDADRPATGYGARDFADDVAAFMDALGLETAVVAGHSMGATNALRFAIDHPDRTAGIVLAGAFASYRRNAVVVDLYESTIARLRDPIDARFVRDFQASTVAQPIAPAFFDAVVTESLKVPARVWRQSFEGLLEDDCSARLSDVEAPALLIWGDRDAIAMREDQQALLAGILRAKLTVYEGCGHALHWERPRPFAADLAGFVHACVRAAAVAG